MEESSKKKSAASSTPKVAKAASPNAPAQTVVTTAPANGLAVAALVVGIIAAVSGWAPFWGVIVGIVAIVLGVIGLKKPGGRGLAIAGIITGAAGALWSLIVSAFFVLALAFGAATTGGIGDELRTLGDQYQDYKNEQQALIDSKKDFSKGSTAVFAGTYEVKVNTVTRNYVPERSYLAAGEGKEYVVLNITIKNISSESQYISPYTFGIVDNGLSKGVAYVSVSPEIESGTLSAGASTTGNVVYEVTKETTNLQLEYDTTVYVGAEAHKLVYTLAI